MIDELPGFASDMTSHETAIAAAQADGWQIKGYSITFVPGTTPDTLMVCLLWKDEAASPGFGEMYTPLREALRVKYKEKMEGLATLPKPMDRPVKVAKTAARKA